MAATRTTVGNLSDQFVNYPQLFVRRRSVIKLVIFGIIAAAGVALSIYVYSDYGAAVELVSGTGRKDAYAILGITIMGPLFAIGFLLLLIFKSYRWNVVATGERMKRLTEQRFSAAGIDPHAALAVIARGKDALPELSQLMKATMAHMGKGETLIEVWSAKNSRVLVANAFTGKPGKWMPLGEPILFQGDDWFDFDTVFEFLLVKPA